MPYDEESQRCEVCNYTDETTQETIVCEQCFQVLHSLILSRQKEAHKIDDMKRSLAVIFGKQCPEVIPLYYHEDH